MFNEQVKLDDEMIMNNINGTITELHCTAMYCVLFRINV